MTLSFRFLKLLSLLALAAAFQNSPLETLAAETPHEPAAAHNVHGTPPNGVGTVDINRIRQKLGITAELERRNQELTQQFTAYVDQKKAEIAKELKQYPEKPEQRTYEQNRKIQQLVNDGNAMVQRVREHASEEMNKATKYYDNLLAEKVRGPVQDIVKRRGLAVVLAKPVFYDTPEADITGEILDALNPASSELPKLPPLSKLPTTGQSAAASGARTSSGPVGDKGTPPKEPTAPPSSTSGEKSTGGAASQKPER